MMLGTSEAMQRGTAAQLSFLVTSLLSSSTRFADLPGHAVTLRRKDRVEEIFRLLRIWCLTSAALATVLVFQGLHTVSPSEAIKSSRLELAQESVLESRSVSSFSSTVHRFVADFREAPSFRNGKHCFSRLRRGTEWDFVCDPNFVHIAMTLDESYLRGSMAAIFSIIQHASCPENIVFHFLVSSEDYEFHSLIRSVFPLLKYKIYHFNENLVKGRISSSVRQALEQPLNYARNYLASILETCVHRILYLDSDVVVIDDIANLWATSLGSKALGAPEYCHANFTKYFTSSFWSDKRLTRTFFGRFPCYFNTGVMIMDLIKWRQDEYTRTIERWMEIQKERRIYELGSLPPFLLVFAGLVEPMSHRWNQHGLGGDNVKGSCRPLHPGPVSLLHWSGNGKPWLRLDSNEPCPVDSLWAPYDLFIS